MEGRCPTPATCRKTRARTRDQRDLENMAQILLWPQATFQRVQEHLESNRCERRMKSGEQRGSEHFIISIVL
eukprot:1158700-Pelagomonas_calceolata.AAC.8